MNGIHLRATAAVLAAGVMLVSACGGTSSSGTQRPPGTGRADRPTVAALLRIARRFNQDYAADDDGSVYDRWDAQSQRVISRADYVRRHRECPTAPGAAVVEGAARARSGYWAVRYSIAGSQLIDYWHYVHDRWLFDLARSNPAAARLYRLPATKYFAAVGCGTHR